LSGKLPLDLVVWVITQSSQRAKFGTILPQKKGCSLGYHFGLVDNHSSKEITYQCWVVLTG